MRAWKEERVWDELLDGKVVERVDEQIYLRTLIDDKLYSRPKETQVGYMCHF